MTVVVPLSRASFLLAAIATHALVGYTLGKLAFGAPRAGLVGGVVADADLLVPSAWGFPLAHRSITHSALAAGVAVAIATAWGRPAAGGISVGYVSQLLIDSTTPMGIPAWYPLSTAYVGVPLGGHSRPATVLLWICCLVALQYYERRPLDRNAGG